MGVVSFLLENLTLNIARPSTYIINGGHQQQDDGRYVQNNDSSQHQHRDPLKTDRGEAEGEGAHRYLIVHTGLVSRENARSRKHTRPSHSERCVKQRQKKCWAEARCVQVRTRHAGLTQTRFLNCVSICPESQWEAAVRLLKNGTRTSCRSW